MSKNLLLVLITTLYFTSSTYAVWSDFSNSSNNNFTAGKIDMRITDGNETIVDTATASYGAIGILPGQLLPSQSISVRNSGNISASVFDVFTDVSVTDFANNSTPDIDSYLILNTLRAGAVSLIPRVSDLNGNGQIDLNDLSNTDLLALGNVPAGFSNNWTLRLQLSSTAPNDIMNDTVDVTFSFRATQ